jgi:sporulation protein YlmC with PRC-barrel domain
MIDQASVPSLLGSTVRDSSGDRIGKVGQVYLDDTTGMPEWVTVRTGLFGTRESFVPLAAAHVDGDEIVVDVAKDRVHDAPQIDEDGHLSEEQEADLYRYYGVDPGPFGRLPDEDLAEPEAGAMDDASYPAVGTLEAPTHEALPDGGYAAGTSGIDPEVEYAGSDSLPTDPAIVGDSAPAAQDPAPESYDPALAAKDDPAVDPTLDPDLDADLDRRAAAAGGDPIAADPQLTPEDVDPDAVDADSPALGGPGDASGTPGEDEAPPLHIPPSTTGEAYETSRHDDAWTRAEEKAEEPRKSRLRRWIGGDS